MKHRLVTSAAAIAVIIAASVTLTSATAGASLKRPAATATGLPAFVVVNQASSLQVLPASPDAWKTVTDAVNIQRPYADVPR